VRGGVVGRDAEQAGVAGLLDGVGSGPAALALWGEAGIGKTTVWAAGVLAARERGYTVLACRPASAELKLTYVGLTDLLAEVSEDVVDRLAVPQRRALDAALLRGAEDDTVPDPRAAAAGLLSVVNQLAAITPLLLAIDDFQWLDEPTRRMVGYATRRCRGPVAVLTTERADEVPDSTRELCPPDPTRLYRLHLGPLSLGALHRVVRQETGRSFPRPMMVRIAEGSAGNPFFAVEMARSVTVAVGGGASFPASLLHIVRDRIASLAPSVCDALLVASAVAEPRLELIGRACGVGDVVELLAPAEESGLIGLSAGCVRFTHPLWANGVYHEASPARRRRLHRLLSELVDDVEERARHLALAATGPVADTLGALDLAADLARRRGAVSAAAELLELAIGLGAPERSVRVQAARDYFDADDPARARELLEAVIAEIGPGAQRAEALGLLGTIVYAVEDYGRAIATLEGAFGEAGGDSRLRCSIALELCTALPNVGLAASALRYAATAVEEAEKVADGGLLAEALGCWVMVRFLAGHGVDEDTLGRALALEDPERRSHALLWPSLNAAMVHLWSRQVDQARTELAALHQRCVERGAESDLWFVLAYATIAALWCGEVEAAESFVAEMNERAAMTGSAPISALTSAVRATVAAWRGHLDEARAAVKAATASLDASRFGGGWLFALGARGMVELSVGDHAAAVERLGQAAADIMAMGFEEPAFATFLPDAAEALIALGRLDEGEAIVELLEASGGKPGRGWAEAVGARCRGLLLAAGGDLEAAAAAYARALAAHDLLPVLRYDRARTVLVDGQLKRRRRERRLARASLEQAVRLFDEVGAAQWAAYGRAELDRVGLRHGAVEQLTPSEERVAVLAASGLTNREVAAALFVSAKTVEANLARIYRKLGIRSRAELGRRMVERPPKGDSIPR
jgi:FimV-like protein